MMEGDNAHKEEVYEHGMSLNPNNDKVQCNYCGTVVAGFDSLQLHLGGVQLKSSECPDAPSNIKKLFRCGSNIVEEKNPRQQAGNLYGADCSTGSIGISKVENSKHVKAESAKKAGNFYSADFPARSIANSKGENRKREKAESSQEDELKELKRAFIDSTVNRKNSFASALDSHNESASPKTVPSREVHQSSSAMIKRSIGRFLIENDIDFEAAKSYSFKKMIEAVSNASGIACHIPSNEELKGAIFSEELKEARKYVNAMKESWSRTGCSVVLDGWADEKGRNFVIVLVDCPLGAVYIQSIDISTVEGDVEGFILTLEGVLEEVGIHNIVQIITHTTSGFMDAVGKRLMDKHKSIFWTVSASHCISVMLEKIGMMSSVKQVIDKAKIVTQFIYNHADVLKVMRSHTRGGDIVKSSKIKASIPFLTLEKILLERENLEIMVSSSEWIQSSWASNVEGRRVADLLHDQSFWDRISIVVRATIPLVKVLSLVNGDGDRLGFIYETMDQVKETIYEELDSKKTLYLPYWDIIDDIWNNVLHSPLHAAGYFLNPGFLYDEDFCTDSEVAGGLLTTIVRMVKDEHLQDTITKQLEIYRRCQGDFNYGIENDKHISMPPAAWWLSYGGQYPHLQKLAVRILSQSCNGAESYGLKKGVAEKLLCSDDPRSRAELSNLACVHYNMILKQKKMGVSYGVDAVEFESMGEWIMNEPDESNDAPPRKGNVSGAKTNGPEKPKVEL